MAITGVEMSQAPKCRFCGDVHWGRCGYQKPTVEPLREGEKPIKAIWHDEAFKAAVSKGVEPVNNAGVTKSVTNKAVNNAKVSVNNDLVTESVTNKKAQGKLRAAKWREKNRDRYNSEMRGLMQNIRAKAKFSHLENMLVTEYKNH